MDLLLSWKSFTVSLEKIHNHLKANLPTNYSGLVCNENELIVKLNNSDDSDIAFINNYWDNLTEDTFAPTADELALEEFKRDLEFCSKLKNAFLVENIKLGIKSFSGRNNVISWTANFHRFLSQGLCESAKNELEVIASSYPEDLEVFLSSTRLSPYITNLEGYING